MRRLAFPFLTGSTIHALVLVAVLGGCNKSSKDEVGPNSNAPYKSGQSASQSSTEARAGNIRKEDLLSSLRRGASETAKAESTNGDAAPSKSGSSVLVDNLDTNVSASPSIDSPIAKEGVGNAAPRPSTSQPPKNNAVGSTDPLQAFSNESADSKEPKSILNSDARILEPERVLRPVEDAPQEKWIREESLPFNTFELSFVADKPIGFTTRQIGFRSTTDTEVLRTEMTSTVRVNVGGVSNDQNMKLITQELLNGTLLRIDGELTIGDTRNEFSGVVEGNVLKMDSLSNGSRSKKNIPWENDFRGPFAIEQSLMRKTLEDDEVRILRHLDPMIGRLVETSLRSVSVGRSSTMLRGAVELREIAVSQRDGQQTIQSTIWVDDKGEILKSNHPNLKLRAFRVSQEATVEYQRLTALSKIDSFQMAVTLESPETRLAIEGADKRPSITFKIDGRDSDPFETVSRKSLQAIRSINARSAEITYFRTADDAGDAKVMERESVAPPQAAVIEDWIDPESPQWQQFKRTIWGERNIDGLSNHDKAVLIRDSLRQRWQVTPTNRRIGNLGNLITTLQGSVLEQSLVLGNLYRSFNIPTRLALGYKLVPAGDEYALVLTSWAEVFDGEKWYSVDPTETGLDAMPNRFKVLESYFQDTRFFEEIARVSKWGEGNTVEVQAP